MSSVVQMSLVEGVRTRKQPIGLADVPDVGRVFAHWVYMMGKNPKRCALGPDRRKAITRALSLYDVETLELAIEGCAASPFHRGQNDRETEYTDICLILRDEAHIERFAELGERLRERAAQAERQQAERAQQEQQQPEDPVAVAAARERLRAMAQRMAARRGGA